MAKLFSGWCSSLVSPFDIWTSFEWLNAHWHDQQTMIANHRAIRHCCFDCAERSIWFVCKNSVHWCWLLLLFAFYVFLILFYVSSFFLFALSVCVCALCIWCFSRHKLTGRMEEFIENNLFESTNCRSLCLAGLTDRLTSWRPDGLALKTSVSIIFMYVHICVQCHDIVRMYYTQHMCIHTHIIARTLSLGKKCIFDCTRVRVYDCMWL